MSWTTGRSHESWGKYRAKILENIVSISQYLQYVVSKCFATLKCFCQNIEDPAAFRITLSTSPEKLSVRPMTYPNLQERPNECEELDREEECNCNGVHHALNARSVTQSVMHLGIDQTDQRTGITETRSYLV